jgi:hypothetical protein
VRAALAETQSRAETPASPNFKTILPTRIHRIYIILLLLEIESLSV